MENVKINENVVTEKTVAEEKPHEKVAEIKQLYEQMLANCEKEGNEQEVKNTISKILNKQKKDGSFSVISSYDCPGDTRVEYVYIPTYYATAALICADMYFEEGLNSAETENLKKGLHFAIGRDLEGFGYYATESLITTLRLYAKAGMYHWIGLRGKDISEEFVEVIVWHYLSFANAIAEGKTYSDWNRNFVEEFTLEVEEFEKYNKVMECEESHMA